MTPPRVDVLGVGISAVDIPSAVDRLDRWVAEEADRYVCVTGVHGVMESQDDGELKTIHNRAGMVTPDGMPLVWLGRIGGQRQMDRVYGPDLMLEVCRQSPSRGWRHYFYGGAEGVPETLAERLTARFPGLEVVGTYSPPFRPLTPEEDEEIVARINASRPHMTWIGLSTPKQERFMAAHVGRVRGIMLGVGAAFDFHAGLKRQAPAWMQRSALEWLFRMVTEPKRLGPRYLRNNPRFLMRIAGQLVRRGVPEMPPPALAHPERDQI